MPFEPVDGGENRACRGSNAADNAQSNYRVYSGAPYLEYCMDLCKAEPACEGIEYNEKLDGGRCEVWTSAVTATMPNVGSVCLRYGTVADPFVPVDGGENRACRGAIATDNSPSHYFLGIGITSLYDCKRMCEASRGCRGIEFSLAFNGGRCELWTRRGGISASVPAANVTCLRYGPSTELFAPADGGVNRVCRGSGPNDDSPDYFSSFTGIASLGDCEDLCTAAPVCKGIEYSGADEGGRCEVWTRPLGIGATKPKTNATCLRTLTESFDSVDGSTNRGCRGAVPEDNSESYYVVHTEVPDLAACKVLCVVTPICVGIEYNPTFDNGRCEVWTRRGGISATTAAKGATCLRYGPPAEQFHFAGGGGDRVCRGASPGDDSPEYYVLHTGVDSLGACEALCVDAPICKGIEYNKEGGRCEVWTRTGGIRSHAPQQGFVCLLYGKLIEQFDLMDGSTDRACRGADLSDNEPGYYVLHTGITSIGACKNLCVKAPVCKGIEYASSFDGGRCEVWTRPGGIRATGRANGTTCLSYGLSSNTFQLVDGGSNRVCRGADDNDTSPSYYVLHDATESLEACMQLCAAAPVCKGIEYSGRFNQGRCEVWTRDGGIAASAESGGATCLRYGPSTEQFEPVDGGLDRACRGAVAGDDSPTYKTIYTNVSTSEACKGLCLEVPGCKGVEYNRQFDGGRCEVWTRAGGISVAVPSEGSECFRYGPPTEQFEPIDNGTDRGCRGASASDHAHTDYVLHAGVGSLSACEALCIRARVCKGIEYTSKYDGGRCEVWTRTEGIGATAPTAGSTCLRYGAVPTARATNLATPSAPAGLPLPHASAGDGASGDMDEAR